MKRKITAIMLIFALLLCSCANDNEDAEADETTGYATTQYDL